MVVTMGIVRIPTYENPLNFFLLICLAAISQMAVTYLSVGENKIAYEVGTAVSLAAVPLYGPVAATVVAAASGFSFWLFTNRKKTLLQRNWQQLAFNIGMLGVAILIAGSVNLELIVQRDMSPWIIGLVWLVTAVIVDQLNLWLLIILLRLLRGSRFKPLHFWHQNRWAMLVNVGVLTMGGFLLSTAVTKFDSLGIIIFFLPILLSSISFKLYVNKMSEHMNNLEAIIAQRTDELTTVMMEKDAFLTVLTHDMKTPLTTINLYLDLLKKRPDILSEKPQILDVLKHSQQTLTEIVNNILDLEKFEADGEIPLEKTSLNIIPLLSYLLETMEAQAKQKNIALNMKSAILILDMLVDQHQIQRVFQNLVSNAIKYTQMGGEICIDIYTTNDQAIIQVMDNGYGIPENELPFVFDRFHRVAKHEKLTSGTGLGLSISKAIVEAHAGTISVTSQEDVGSIFTVQLPL
jgi:signal transduction histidine kinase